MTKITLAQFNPMVGDIDNNVEQILKLIQKAQPTECIVFPELALTGYPPEDLLHRPAFIESAWHGLEKIINEIGNTYCIIGVPIQEADGLKNSAVVIHDHTIIAAYHKQKLPNYGVFDEYRYFTPGNQNTIFKIGKHNVGLTICEDIWTNDVAQSLKSEGADFIISLNASPFEIDKAQKRVNTLKEINNATGLPLLYVNCLGGQDELVFDGGSMAMNAEGDVIAHAPFFEENLLDIDSEKLFQAHTGSSIVEKDDNEKIYHALVLGVKDYIEKNQFPSVIIGLSGGIDSALTLKIAVDAIGANRVHAVMMPSRFTSDISLEDAKLLAERLKVRYDIISIEKSFEAFNQTLHSVFANTTLDSTEENIQARCRGIILMALSNKFKSLVLTTGNRSEMAVGYSTLYGDMAGGFCVLKDIPKTRVFELSNYINRDGEIIPQRTIDRPPSAELAEDQKDQDSLPSYDILDKIIHYYVDLQYGMKQIIAKDFDEAVVKKIIQLIDFNEYKRRQSPPGVRINHKAFGRDRRYPITNRFKSSS
ncbi:MAG: NAD+ synthase [Gammaproteobacteria bacterium]